jgi:hypothetical protein
MGMDVCGRNPTSSAGEYFRANVWSWRPIHALMTELCGDLLGEELLDAMAFNDGAGPADQETCTEMAKRFDLWMEHHASGLELEGSDLRIAEDGHIVSDEELLENPDLKTRTPYEVEDEHLKEWIEFLRHCGGFEVW